MKSHSTPAKRWQPDSAFALGKCQTITSRGRPCRNDAVRVRAGVKVCRMHRK